jgi:hypothetical protein
MVGQPSAIAFPQLEMHSNSDKPLTVQLQGGGGENAGLAERA